MAAPQVSGVAALMAAVRNDLSAADLRSQLIQNEPLVGPGRLRLRRRAGRGVGGVGGDELRRRAAPGAARAARHGLEARAQRDLRRPGRRQRRHRGRRPLPRHRRPPPGRPAATRVAVHRPREAARQDGEAGQGRGARPARGRSWRARRQDPQGRQGQAPRGRRRRAADVGGRRSPRGGRGPPPHGARSRGRISLSGSNVALPLVADLAFYYRRAVRHPPRFTLTGGGSAAGLSDTARGIVDVGLTIRPRSPTIPPGWCAAARRERRLLVPPNRANPIPSLNRAQIQDLVSGRVTVWEHVAGAPMTGRSPRPRRGRRRASARCSSRPSSTSRRARLPPADVQHAPAGALLGARDAQRVGYVDFAFTRGLHVVPYEGVPCSRASIAAGIYPVGARSRSYPRGAARSGGALHPLGSHQRGGARSCGRATCRTPTWRSCGAGTRTPITSSRGWRLAIRRPRKTRVSLAPGISRPVARSFHRNLATPLRCWRVLLDQ